MRAERVGVFYAGTLPVFMMGVIHSEGTFKIIMGVMSIIIAIALFAWSEGWI